MSAVVEDRCGGGRGATELIGTLVGTVSWALPLSVGSQGRQNPLPLPSKPFLFNAQHPLNTLC